MPNSSPDDISVIIVNYNTSDFLARCLDSIGRPENLRIEVIVVDNDSQDDSVDMVKQRFPWVTLIANKQHNLPARVWKKTMMASQSAYVFLYHTVDNRNKF